jgi:hypothetical protein
MYYHILQKTGVLTVVCRSNMAYSRIVKKKFPIFYNSVEFRDDPWVVTDPGFLFVGVCHYSTTTPHNKGYIILVFH